MSELTITVPNSLWLTSNGRYHWAQKAKATAELRRLAQWVAKAKKAPMLQRAHILVHVQYATTVRADPLNAAPTVKALIDGFIDYGLLPDDDSSRLEGPDLRRDEGKCPRGAHRLRFVITPLEN